MSSKRSKQKLGGTYSQTHYLEKPGRPPLIKEHYAKDPDGTVVNYGLAYIDHLICSEDNGRVLGYDNGHQFHERHLMGKAEKVDFTSFEDQAIRFFDEVDKIRKGVIHVETQGEKPKPGKLSQRSSGKRSRPRSR